MYLFICNCIINVFIFYFNVIFMSSLKVLFLAYGLYQKTSHSLRFILENDNPDDIAQLAYSIFFASQDAIKV